MDGGKIGRVYGVGVKGVGKCVGVWERVEKSGGSVERCGSHTLFYTSPHTSSHLPQQFLTTFISLLQHFPIFFHTYFIIYSVPKFLAFLICVHLVAGRLGFYSQSGHTKDFKNSICSFCARRLAQAEVRRVLCMCCSSCMSLNSVQSFVIENCNGPTIENGLNNVRLHPLSRTFTLYCQISLTIK